MASAALFPVAGRDIERLPQHGEAHINWTLITLMTRRLTRKGPRTDGWARKPAASSAEPPTQPAAGADAS